VEGKLCSSSITNCIFRGIYSLCKECYGGVLRIDISHYLDFIIDGCIFSKGNATRGVFIHTTYYTGLFPIFRTRFEDDLLVRGYSLSAYISCYNFVNKLNILFNNSCSTSLIGNPWMCCEGICTFEFLKNCTSKIVFLYTY
jgi:hypothetical protein